MHPAVIRMTFARLTELIATCLIFGLFTAQYGHKLSIPFVLLFDMLSIAIMICVTWKQQNYKLANTKTTVWGVARRYFLTLPLLMMLHFDHIPVCQYMSIVFTCIHNTICYHICVTHTIEMYSPFSSVFFVIGEIG